MIETTLNQTIITSMCWVASIVDVAPARSKEAKREIIEYRVN